MATTRAEPDANSPSRQVLSELPGRVVTFLSAVGRDGATELAAWWSTNSKRLETAVARLHPEHTDLFAGIEAHDEPSSILAVAALLARIEQKQRAGAKALFTTLSRRRLDATERARLGALVEAAQKAGSLAPAPRARLTPQRAHRSLLLVLLLVPRLGDHGALGAGAKVVADRAGTCDAGTPRGDGERR
jgi:hypothetical protein